MKTIRAMVLWALSAATLYGQNVFVAYDAPAGAVGNQVMAERALGHDFHVTYPITVSQLGVFDSGTNGIRGSSILTVQLYERNGNSGLLLETLTFDAPNPGTLINGSRFKPLANPVTLWPGNYSIVAYGFDQNNPAAKAGEPRSAGSSGAWRLNTGDDSIRFEDTIRSGPADLDALPSDVTNAPPFQYAAGTFAYSRAALPPSPYAADYAALTAGVRAFPLEDLRHLGSLIVWSECAFPILAEQGGNRQIVAAASRCPTNGARAVAFAHSQWGRSVGDDRMKLFENAIRWASRKSNPSEIVLGVGPRLDTNYFLARGYQVRPFEAWMPSSTNSFPECDVVVADWGIDYASRVLNRIGLHVGQGKGVVVTTTPQLLTYRNMRSAFGRLNQLLDPFGISYRAVLSTPVDFGFTNIQSVPYPVYFNTIAAAEMLREDRKGRSRMDSLAKAMAFHSINYASMSQPQVLSALTAIYSGTTNLDKVPSAGESAVSFVDVVSLMGAQATSNRLGNWWVEGSDLVAKDRRGSVEYQFAVPAADVYKLRIEATQNLPNPPSDTFPLVLTLDGLALGQENLVARYGAVGAVECWTPYLLPGTHRLRILWDNPRSLTALKLKSIRIQAGLGGDQNDNDIKDWVEQRVAFESGLDLTNAVIESLTSPVCLEGRDPYPSLMRVLVAGADNQTYNLSPEATSDGRWYVNAPLSAYANAEPILRVVYQNGALTETRGLRWSQLNVLTASNQVVRKGDSLLLNAIPDGAPSGLLQISVGTDVRLGVTAQPIAFQFSNAGIYTVTGTYVSDAGRRASRSINVKVVEQELPRRPACWVGMERSWDLTRMAPEAVLEADARLFCEQTASLPGGGIRLSLLTDQNQPRSILARLGRKGPVLDSTQARSFHLWSGSRTYTRVLRVYPDGSQLVEMLLISSPVLPDVTIRLDTIVGGVVFEDGTARKKITAADFDSRGQYLVRFIRPASARTSVCHSIKAFQGSELVGYLR